MLCLPPENLRELGANLPKHRLLFRSHTASDLPQVSQHEMKEDDKYIMKSVFLQFPRASADLLISNAPWNSEPWEADASSFSS